MSSPLPFEPPSPSLTPLPDERLTAHHLPASLTPLIGRINEIDEIWVLLDVDETRLLTLTGPGGIGKTRLALEVAHRAIDDYAHGACFVSLAPVREPSLASSAVAQTLGIRERGDRPASELVAAILRDQHLLLVLDNLEHLGDEAALWVGELLQSCPRLSALVTSRIALNVAGEQRYPVPPLPVPNRTANPSVESVSAHDSVKLFAQRAHAVRPDFVLDADNAEAIGEICRQVDGLPLAIELAAARISHLSPNAMQSRLVNRLALLTGGARDSPARHQTIRDAIGWSYDLLSIEERLAFRRLSVFVGGFSLDGAEAILCSDESTGHEPGSLTAVDRLSSLVNHSLVIQGPTSGESQRFRMLETIREYGLDQLRSLGEERHLRDAHAAFCLRMASEAEPAMKGPAQVVWLDRLEAEHDNLRAVFGWLTECARIDEAMELAGSIWFFRWIRGYFSEGRNQLDVLLAHPLGAERTVARAKALNAAGITALSQGENERSRELHDEAIEIFRELGANNHVALALMCLAATLSTSEELDAATLAATESLEIARELNDVWEVSGAINILGSIALAKGDMEYGTACMEEGATLSRRLGDRWGLALALGNLGLLAVSRGQPDEARPYIEESTDLIRQLGDKRDLPFGLDLLADIARNDGDFKAAQGYLDDALSVSREIGDKLNLGFSLLSLGRLASAQRQWERALQFQHDALTVFRQIESQAGLVESLDEIAGVAVATRNMATAARMLGAADSILTAHGIARMDGTSTADYQRRRDAAQTTMGQQAFDTSYRAGVELTTEEAIAEAHAFAPSPMNVSRASNQRSGFEVERLSPRELEVLRLMADGLTNQEIADTLFVSRRTATSHSTNILGKLGLASRTAAVAYAIRNGLA